MATLCLGTISFSVHARVIFAKLRFSPMGREVRIHFIITKAYYMNPYYYQRMSLRTYSYVDVGHQALPQAKAIQH